MFLIEDKKGRELDRWSTLELAVESAKQFLREDPKRGALTIWEGNQQTGKRTKVQTVRHSSKESNPASSPFPQPELQDEEGGLFGIKTYPGKESP